MEARQRWTTDDIRNTITKSDVVVFAKGEDEGSKCGFSKLVLDALRKSGRSFEIVNVLSDPSISAALRSYSGHPELPLVYAKGSLIPCSDDLRKPVDSASLCKAVEKAVASK